MSDSEKTGRPVKGRKSSDSSYLRGYCRVCNRHYFYKNRINTEHVQFHQYHSGVCQKCRKECARIDSITRS